ncbi:unnamed protein product [Lactuca saligna]|uniref:Transposase (putative) gypsy type domain-containing protein n=1 Tax=Lactuca saligna TaxID=75948 RepID=A0AA35YCU2_LACSI|nr:unnamed protein product [Lactuca saligna]
MANLPGIIPSSAEYRKLEVMYGLSFLEGVEFPSAGSSISSPPGKIVVFLKTLDVGIRLPLTDFQEEVLQKDGCSLQMLTPNVVNKVVAFEMICRANGATEQPVIPDLSSVPSLTILCAPSKLFSAKEFDPLGSVMASNDSGPGEGTREDAASREMVLVNDIGVGGNGKDCGASGDGRVGAGGGGVDEVADDREVSDGLAGKAIADDVVVGDKFAGDGSKP